MPDARRHCVASWIKRRLAAATDWDNDEHDHDDGDGGGGAGVETLVVSGSANNKTHCHGRTRLSTRSMIAIGTLLLAVLILQPIEVIMDDSDQQKQQQQQHRRHRRDDQEFVPHGEDRPFRLVDTKFWLGSTEFANNLNWLDQKRPCSLLERIAIAEEGVVVSLDHNADNAHYGVPLEPATIQELLLANNGLILLPTNTTSVNHADNLEAQGSRGQRGCVDSATLLHDDDDATQNDDQQFRFLFRLDPNDLSWFNRHNWLSAKNYDDVAEMEPDSHKVPCNEDSVVIGSQVVSWLDEINDTAIPFKVNFRPNEEKLQTDKEGTANEPTTSENKLKHTTTTGGRQAQLVDTLRVSKLVIGDRVYTNDELDELLRLYEDNLFGFNDEKSIFSLAVSGANLSADGDDRSQKRGARQRTLNIDQSSVLEGEYGESDYCLEGAGCMCGNERPALMEAICSFAPEPKPGDLLCLDPIRSQGYCSPICGASLIINMVPSKFSESYLAGLVMKIMYGLIEGYEWPSGEYDAEHLIVVPRRIDHTRYELTSRLTALDANHYQGILGKDLLLAKLVKQELEKAAVKSFYGIKSISIRSSVVWRQNNRDKIFWLTFAVALSLSISLLARYDFTLPVVLVTLRPATLARWFVSQSAADTNEMSFMGADGQSSEVTADVASADDLERVATEREIALAELDARSITDSTCGLLDDK